MSPVDVFHRMGNREGRLDSLRSQFIPLPPNPAPGVVPPNWLLCLCDPREGPPRLSQVRRLRGRRPAPLPRSIPCRVKAEPP